MIGPQTMGIVGNGVADDGHRQRWSLQQPTMESPKMGPRIMHVADNGFAYKGIAFDGLGPPKIGITGNRAADNSSTDDTAPDDGDGVHFYGATGGVRWQQAVVNGVVDDGRCG